MNRPVCLLLTLREAEALTLLLATHKPVWNVVAHDLDVDPDALEARLVEAHRGGLAVAQQTPI